MKYTADCNERLNTNIVRVSDAVKEIQAQLPTLSGVEAAAARGQVLTVIEQVGKGLIPTCDELQAYCSGSNKFLYAFVKSKFFDVDLAPLGERFVILCDLLCNI